MKRVLAAIGLLAALAAAPARADVRGQAVVNQTVTYTGPDAGAITAANVAVTVFAANTVSSGCDIINNGTVDLYVDMTTAAAVIGSATAIPVAPGASWHCPYPPKGAVGAVAASPTSFVAVRY